MFVDITSREELRGWAEQIFSLYLTVYDRPLHRGVWSWFYADNPIGDPMVSLYVQDGKLVGHYATVPTRLLIDGESVVAHRSMTTMVHPDMRGRGLFYSLACRAYEYLETAGIPLVYGFPNRNSAPVFAGRLGWTLPPPDTVVDLTGDQITSNPDLTAVLTERGDICWDTQDSVQHAWRLANPAEPAVATGGLIIKPYGGRPNLLHAAPGALGCLVPEETYRLLARADLAALLPDAAKVFNYQFGYRVFGQPDAADLFKRELILSDVF